MFEVERLTTRSLLRLSTVLIVCTVAVWARWL